MYLLTYNLSTISTGRMTIPNHIDIPRKQDAKRFAKRLVRETTKFKECCVTIDSGKTGETVFEIYGNCEGHTIMKDDSLC